MKKNVYGDYTIPTGMRGRGRAAAILIRDCLLKRKALFTGGGGKFYTPTAWERRGEWDASNPRPRRVVLLLTHDGGDLSLYSGNPAHWTAISRALSKHGFHLEHQTGWYTAVFDTRYN